MSVIALCLACFWVAYNFVWLQFAAICIHQGATGFSALQVRLTKAFVLAPSVLTVSFSMQLCMNCFAQRQKRMSLACTCCLTDLFVGDYVKLQTVVEHLRNMGWALNSQALVFFRPKAVNRTHHMACFVEKRLPCCRAPHDIWLENINIHHLYHYATKPRS